MNRYILAHGEAMQSAILNWHSKDEMLGRLLDCIREVGELATGTGKFAKKQFTNILLDFEFTLEELHQLRWLDSECSFGLWDGYGGSERTPYSNVFEWTGAFCDLCNRHNIGISTNIEVSEMFNNFINCFSKTI